MLIKLSKPCPHDSIPQSHLSVRATLNLGKLLGKHTTVLSSCRGCSAHALRQLPDDEACVTDCRLDYGDTAVVGVTKVNDMEKAAMVPFPPWNRYSETKHSL